MDINQQLEYLNLSSDVLTENDVIDILRANDTKKVVSSKGIYDALQNLSLNISTEYALHSELDSLFTTLSNELSNYYTKRQTYSNVEIDNTINSLRTSINSKLPTARYDKEISNYVLLSTLLNFGFLSNHQSLSNYYNKAETNNEINKLSNIYIPYIGNSTISGNLSIAGNISSDYNYIRFQNLINICPLPLFKNFISAINDTYIKYSFCDTICEICEKLNELIIFYKLPIELIDTFDITSKPYDETLSIIQNMLIKIGELTKIVLPNIKDIESIIVATNIIIHDIIYTDFSENVQLSLSALADKIQLNKTYLLYVKCQINYLLFNINNFYKKNEVSSSQELDIAFKNYQLAGDYVLRNQVCAINDIKNAFNDVYTRYLLKGNYALSNEVSSKYELEEAFKKCSKLSINVSSDAELSTEFAKYAHLTDLHDYALKNSVSTKYEISSEFIKYQKLGNYALSNEVSSDKLLSIEFKKYVKTTDLSNYVDKEYAKIFALSSDIDDKLEKYALSSNVSSKYELEEAFAKCSKLSINVSSDAELSAEFAKYTTTDELIAKYAQKNKVSSDTQLCVKFNQIDKQLSTFVKLSGDSDISGNISIREKLLPNVLSVKFSNIKNSDPKILLSTYVNTIDLEHDYFDYESTIHELYEKLNEAIIYYDLPIELFDGGVNTSCNISNICHIVNQICDITKKPKYLNDVDILTLLSSANDNISALSAITYTNDVELSLSALAKLGNANKIYIKYISDIVNDIIFALNDYAKKNYTSSIIELSDLFDKYYTKEQSLNTKLIYDLLSDYAISADVSSKYEIREEFRKYAPLNILSNYVKTHVLNKYALSANVAEELKRYALCSDVSSKIELSNKFKDIDDEFLDVVHLDRDSSISANVELRQNTYANYLSSNIIHSDFEKIVNSNPQLLLSTVTETLDGNENFGIIYSRINQLIIDSELPIPLLDVKSAKASDLDSLLSTINEICKITKTQRLNNFDFLDRYIANINTNILKLSSALYSYNVQQSLSGLANKIKSVRKECTYNIDMIADLASEFEKGYAKYETSSAYELRKAFNNKQDKGDYAYISDLTSTYATMSWTDDNFIRKDGTVPNIINTENVFKKDVKVENTLIADSLSVDFAKFINAKKETCLSAYLLFMQEPFVLDIVIRINEIIEYCKLDFEKIRRPENIYVNILSATNYILQYAKMPLLKYGATYFDIYNILNVAITRIHVKNGLSLQQVLQAHQYTNMLQTSYMHHMYKLIEELSALNIMLKDKLGII